MQDSRTIPEAAMRSLAPCLALLAACGAGTAPGTSCARAVDCATARLVCVPMRHACVPCVCPSDCLPSQECAANTCRAVFGCSSDVQCTGGQRCDVAHGRCADCVVDGDCAA